MGYAPSSWALFTANLVKRKRLVNLVTTDIEIWVPVHGNNLKPKLACFEREKGHNIFFQRFLILEPFIIYIEPSKNEITKFVSYLLSIPLRNYFKKTQWNIISESAILLSGFCNLTVVSRGKLSTRFSSDSLNQFTIIFSGGRARVFVFRWGGGRSIMKNVHFLPGRAVNHFPKTSLQVAQIFTKQSKGNESHTMH